MTRAGDALERRPTRAWAAQWVWFPRRSQGLQTNPAINASQGVAVWTDGWASLTTYTLDSLGQPTRDPDPDGGIQTYQYDFASQPTVYTDALGRVTQYTYSVRCRRRRADPGDQPRRRPRSSYQYDPTFHQVTQETDELGRRDDHTTTARAT